MPIDFKQMKRLTLKPEPEELRRDILDDVLRGIISPEDAEKNAIKNGLGDFSRYSDAKTFPVMEEDVWSIDMALAWIIWRVPEKVTEYWSNYRRTCLGWTALYSFVPEGDGPQKPKVAGYQLVQFPQQSIFSRRLPGGILVINQQNAPIADEKISSVTAEKALRSALINSQLVASATDCASGKIVDIPAREWPRIHFLESEGTELFIPPANLNRPEEVDSLYREVSLLRNDVVRLWPQTRRDFISPRIEPKPSSPVDEREYRKWLAGLPKTHQIVGRFFWDVWALDIKPIDDESRYRQVEKYTKDVLNGVPPSHRSIARFFEDVERWLETHAE